MMISSPGFVPMARQATSRADVPLATDMPWRAPMYSVNWFSKWVILSCGTPLSFLLGYCDHISESNTSCRFFFSVSP
ncbi:MAG: hypothetical protein BWZ10_02692 [candidate division BRC1 bacterium ADurb.BinA364]|nr:MAG: hypothetical protein BWZ10_02692 [candidate division BRC1 bacterium ADurb.BinA364]